MSVLIKVVRSVHPIQTAKALVPLTHGSLNADCHAQGQTQKCQCGTEIFNKKSNQCSPYGIQDGCFTENCRRWLPDNPDLGPQTEAHENPHTAITASQVELPR